MATVVNKAVTCARAIDYQNIKGAITVKTYRILVRVPVGSSGSMMRMIEVRIQASDVGAAKGIAIAQYGSENVKSLPIEVR